MTQVSISTVPDSTREAMAHAGHMSQSELARAIGVRPQAIQYLLSPEKGATGSKHTASIAGTLNVSADWLASGSGNMLDRKFAVQSMPPSSRFGTPAVKVDPLTISQAVELVAQALTLLPEAARAEAAPLLQALSLAPDSTTLKTNLVAVLGKRFPTDL